MAKRKTIEFHFTASFRDSGVSTGICDALLTCEDGCYRSKTTRTDFGDLETYEACLKEMNRSIGEKYSDYCNYTHVHGWADIR